MSQMIVLFTTDANRAEPFIHKILDMKLAAGANLISGLSTYFWNDGKVVHEQESIILVRTIEEVLPKLKEIAIAEDPEIEVSVLEVNQLNEKYLKWINNSLEQTSA